MFILLDQHNVIKIKNSVIGHESIYFNDKLVSKQFAIKGATHTWDISERGAVVDYKVVIKMYGIKNSMTLYKNNEEIDKLQGSIQEMVRISNQKLGIKPKILSPIAMIGCSLMGITSLTGLLAFTINKHAATPVLTFWQAMLISCLGISIGGALGAGKPYWHGFISGLVGGCTAIIFLSWYIQFRETVYDKEIFIMYVIGGSPGIGLILTLKKFIKNKSAQLSVN